MLSLFRRRNKHTESVPALTAWERRALREPSARPGELPEAVAEQMQRDAMVQTVLTVKRLAVTSAPWRLVPAPGPDGARAAEFAAEAFARMDGSPLSVLDQAMDAFAKGWSIQELVLRPQGGRLWIDAVRAKDPASFGLDFDAFGRLRGLTLRPADGPPRTLPRSKFVLYFHRADYRYPRGRSDLDAALPHWRAKQALLTAWRVHLEKYAMPTVMGRYRRGLPPDEQTQILRALQDLQHHAAVVHPDEIEVGLLGGDRGPSTGFQEAVEFHDRAIARAVLGQTLTTDEGRRVGSLALGKVHLQVLMMQIEALRRDLADRVMNEQILRPLTEANFGPGASPRFEFLPTEGLGSAMREADSG